MKHVVQIVEQEGRLPDAVVACIGGGSNAIGMFYPFVEDKEVALIRCRSSWCWCMIQTRMQQQFMMENRCPTRCVYVFIAR